MIEVKQIKKFYKNVRALDGVDLFVPQGTVKALLGPNGAGKTTLVRIMATLLRPDSGSVTITGLDALHDTTALRSKIGLTGQYAAIDEDLTGFENLNMFGRLYHLPRAQAKQRATELLEQFHLTEAAHRTSKTYSGGMRRRLDLASSLIVNPPVLFLDEPTTGLDPASRLDLWEIIRQLVSGGTTVLLTTQYLEEADQLADSIAVINKGKIIAEGTADELKAKSGGHVLEVSIKETAHVEPTMHILQQLAKQPVERSSEHLHFTVPISGEADIVIEVIRALDAKEIGIMDIQLRRPTLDDVFIALTGDKTGE